MKYQIQPISGNRYKVTDSDNAAVTKRYTSRQRDDLRPPETTTRSADGAVFLTRNYAEYWLRLIEQKRKVLELHNRNNTIPVQWLFIVNLTEPTAYLVQDWRGDYLWYGYQSCAIGDVDKVRWTNKMSEAAMFRTRTEAVETLILLRSPVPEQLTLIN